MRIIRNTGDLSRAVSLLSGCLPHVADPHMAGLVREEPGHYRKRLLGGWKYTGEN